MKDTLSFIVQPVFNSSFRVQRSSFALMIGLQPSTFEEFEREAARGNVVPVVRTVLADLQTPVGAFLRVAGEGAYAFLLESVEGGERIARFSFIGAEPEVIVRGRGARTLVGQRREA